MTAKVVQKREAGKVCWTCCICGRVLVRIESGGILGDGLMELDELVIETHYVIDHART